jgi:hypothetical protein
VQNDVWFWISVAEAAIFVLTAVVVGPIVEWWWETVDLVTDPEKFERPLRRRYYRRLVRCLKKHPFQGKTLAAAQFDEEMNVLNSRIVKAAFRIRDNPWAFSYEAHCAAMSILVGRERRSPYDTR